MRVSPEGILMMANLPSRDISCGICTCRADILAPWRDVAPHCGSQYQKVSRWRYIVLPISGGHLYPTGLSGRLSNRGELRYNASHHLYNWSAQSSQSGWDSYSMVFDKTGNIILISLEVDHTVNLFMTTPTYRMVILPWLFLPPVFLAGESRLFSGVIEVMSSYELITLNLWPGVVGLYSLAPFI